MADAVARSTLRARLLAAFALVSLPPLLFLAAAVLVLVGRAFETGMRRQLEQGLGATQRRLASLERRATAEVATIADELDGLTLDERTAAGLAERHQLQALEILAADGRVLSSAHWPAGFGLPDHDQTFEGAPEIRLETTASGYGSVETLTLTASRNGSWNGKPVLIRGGYFLDDAFWSEMHDLLGVEVGLRDRHRGAFTTRAASPLVGWNPPTPRGDGPLADGSVHRWTSAARGPDLLLVVAAPTGDWDALSHRVRTASLGIVGFTLVLSIASALALARRIAGPATALAEAAGRVAAGDLSAQAVVSGDDELARLGQAFNAMTSDLRTAQARLVQAERVAAWREIARRLAHELKNPIFPIALSMQTLQRATAGVTLPSAGGADLTRLLGESIATTLDELRRLQRVVDEFSAFVRMPQPQMKPTDLAVVAQKVSGLYQARAGQVSLDLALDASVPKVRGDEDLLVRAVGNLVANGLDAMPDGGTLHIRTLARPDGVAVEVEDSGPGLTEEQKEHLFTPYFTTKPGGTGLGLAIVQGIASDHGGRVDVRAATERGTVFSIVLPTAAIIPTGAP